MPITPQAFANYDVTTGAGDPSTPISAAFMTAWAARMVTENAAAFAAISHTQAASTISDFAAAVTALIPASTGNMTGTYAARPAANAVASGTIYYPTNIPEAYRSNGTAWSVVGSGGSELGYAQSTTICNTSSLTNVDVPGLTTTFTPGERPVEIRLSGDFACNGVGDSVIAHLIVNSVEVTAIQEVGGTPADKWHTKYRSQRVSGLTPGVAVNAKIALSVLNAAAVGRIVGAAASPMYVQVVTL